MAFHYEAICVCMLAYLVPTYVCVCVCVMMDTIGCKLEYMRVCVYMWVTLCNYDGVWVILICTTSNLPYNEIVIPIRPEGSY